MLKTTLFSTAFFPLSKISLQNHFPMIIFDRDKFTTAFFAAIKQIGGIK